MDRIQSQFTTFTKLLFDPKTAEAYQTVLVVTWTLLKEAALLLWLIICSVFVLGAWIGENAISSGRNVKDWVTQQSDNEADSSEKLVATGQALLDIGQSGVNTLLDQARVQLGIEKPERPAKAIVDKTASAASTPGSPSEPVAASPAPQAATATPTTTTQTATEPDSESGESI